MSTNTELLASFPEINPANYTDDDVNALNAWGISAHSAIEALEAENASITNDALKFVAERDALQAEVEWLTALYENSTAAHEETVGRAMRAEAQLAAAQGQEPIHWVVPHYGFTFPTEEAAQQYQDNLECADRPIACYSAPIPQQPSVPEGWKQAVALAYGHLWHVNNEPMAPIPLRSSETAAYEARKQLRDLLTHEERGLAINQVQALLAAAPQPKEPK